MEEGRKDGLTAERNTRRKEQRRKDKMIDTEYKNMRKRKERKEKKEKERRGLILNIRNK